MPAIFLIFLPDIFLVFGLLKEISRYLHLLIMLKTTVNILVFTLRHPEVKVALMQLAGKTMVIAVNSSLTKEGKRIASSARTAPSTGAHSHH